MNGRLSIFVTLCCVLLQVCALVEGLYQLEVTVFGYDNPTGRCQDCLGDDDDDDDGGSFRGCCDNFESTSCSGSSLCDSYFTYCLRTTGSTGRGCSYFGNRISNVNGGDSPLNFSQSVVLGLENPITLQGLTSTYMGVQLHIEVVDSDTSGRDDLIDVVLIDHNLPIGQPSSRQIHTGIFGFVTMDLSITARCVDNFQGADCSQCIPGFTGPMCNININDCIGVNCSGNGQCVDGVLSYTCNCDPGFTGVDCGVNIDDCAGVANCGENGVCLDGLRSFTCQCSPGFTGELCQTNIDDCMGVNCSGNGVCLDGVNAFTCQCNPGFGGTVCADIVLEGVNVNVEMSDSDSISTTGSSKELLIAIVGGAVGGAVNIIIFVVLITILLIIIKRRTKQKLKPNIDATLNNDEELVDNEMYGASIPNYYYTIVPEEAHQTKDSDSTPMKRNVCYAATIIGDERYSYVSWSSHHGNKNTQYNNVVDVHDSPNDDV